MVEVQCKTGFSKWEVVSDVEGTMFYENVEALVLGILRK